MARDREGGHWSGTAILLGWFAVLVCVIVFKLIPTVHIGHRMYRFGGGYRTGPANLVPFHTILPQLQGRGNRLMSTVNLLGNVLPFVPVGLLAPFAFRRMTWAKGLLLAVGTGLLMEALEVVFRVGIFDVDDILLNGLGVSVGYLFVILR